MNLLKTEQDLILEEQLLIDLADNNHKAFEKLYQLHWLYVYNEAYRRLRIQEDAENISQDVFINLWENRTKVQIKNLKAYLYVLTKNRTLNYLLKNKPERIEDYNIELAGESSPLQELLLKEASQDLHRKLLNLPTQQRTIFTMRYQENLSTDDIAQSMGLSVKTVRNHLGKAIKALRSIFQSLLIFFTNFYL